MKKTILLSLLTCLFLNCYSQAPNWLWANNATGGSCFVSGTSVIASPSGNIYMSGRSAGTITIGGKSITAGCTSVLSGQFTPSGTFNWLASHSYTCGTDYNYALAIDKSENTFCTGGLASGCSGYIDKYDNTGTKIWQVLIPGTNGYGLATDVTGNVYITGTLCGTATFGSTNLTPVGGGDVFVAKYNSAGTCVWAVKGGGSQEDGGRAICVDQTGNVYVCGSYNGSATFGTITPPAAVGYPNLFIAKYDPDGLIQWLTPATNAGFGSSFQFWNYNGMTIDSCANIYVAGHFENTAQFGPFTLNSAGSRDAFVAKMLSGGTWEWVTPAGGTGGDDAIAIALDRNFNPYITGSFNGTANFSGVSKTSTCTNGGNSLFVAKYANSTGDLQWVQVGTGTGSSGGSGITIDKNGYTYVMGTFNSTVTFGSTSVTDGTGCNQDIFITKLDTSPPLKIQALPDPLYCPGSTKALKFTVVGTFNTGNTFTAQLSDANQSFANNPVTIGTSPGTGSGTIDITIPLGTPPGNYLIRIISSSPAWGSFNNNCYSISSFPLFLPGTTSIDKAFTVDISANSTVCPAAVTPLEVSGGTSYLWTPAATLSCDTCSKPTASPLVTTTYSVTVSNGQCPPQKDSVVITVVPLPVVKTGRDTSICLGQSVQLNAAGAFNYVWSPSDGLDCVSCSNPIATPTVNTTYVVTGTNQLCSAKDTVVVNLSLIPTLAVRDTFVCDNQPIQLTIVSNGSLLWIPDDGITCTSCNDPVIQVHRETVYYITATIGVCSVYDSLKVSVDYPSVNAGTPSTIYKGSTAKLNAYGAEFYSWSPADDLSNSTISNPDAKPLSTTVYTVKGIDSAGCASNSDVTITVIDPCTLPSFPNAFTPNHDGQNDMFGIINQYVEEVLDFKIFNRWGQLVYETSNLNKGWDGNFNGKPEPTGTYVYYVSAVCQGNAISFKGNITLIR